MSIRPIDFNGMIQNQHEVGAIKTRENQQPTIRQDAIMVEINREEDAMSHQVQHTDETAEYNFHDREGDGSGYKRKKDKDKKKNSNDDAVSDGTVTLKSSRSSFDVSI